MAAVDPLGSQGRYTAAVNNITDLAGITNLPRDTSKKFFMKQNAIINYCDSMKDGSVQPSVTQNNNFKSILASLYDAGNPLSWQRTLDAEKERIMTNTEYGNLEPIKLSFLRVIPKGELQKKLEKYQLFVESSENPITNFPPNVTHAIQESGYSPLELNNQLQIFVTPASYIDPASRKKLSDPGTVKFSGEVTDKVFEALGFAGAIKTFDGQIQEGNSCKINMTFPFNQPAFETNRNVSFENTQGEDYFVGNPEKNRYISEGNNDDKAKKYVLFKELGDTLQVVYAKFIMGGETDLSLCVFTGDDTVVARCRELGVPVSYQVNVGKEYANLGRTLYYPHKTANEADLYGPMIEQYFNNCINNNKNVIDNIVKYKNIVGTKELIRKYFQDIINDISGANTKLTTLKSQIVEPLTIQVEPLTIQAVNDFKKKSLEHTAIHIISVEGEIGIRGAMALSYELNDNIRFLFVKSDLGLNDTIATGIVSLKEQVTFLQKQRSERGAQETPEEVAAKAAKKVKAAEQREKLKNKIKEAEQAATQTLVDMSDIGRFNEIVKDYIERKRAAETLLELQLGGGFDTTDDSKISELPFMSEYYNLVKYILIDIIISDTVNDEWDMINVNEGGIDIVLTDENELDESDTSNSLENPIEEKIEDVAYSFTCLSYIYFHHIGTSCLNPKVLKIFITKFIKDGMKDYTLEQFKTDYEAIDIVKQAEEAEKNRINEIRESQEYKDLQRAPASATPEALESDLELEKEVPRTPPKPPSLDTALPTRPVEFGSPATLTGDPFSQFTSPQAASSLTASFTALSRDSPARALLDVFEDVSGAAGAAPVPKKPRIGGVTMRKAPKSKAKGRTKRNRPTNLRASIQRILQYQRERPVSQAKSSLQGSPERPVKRVRVAPNTVSPSKKAGEQRYISPGLRRSLFLQGGSKAKKSRAKKYQHRRRMTLKKTDSINRMSCTVNRWGPGTTCEKPRSTELAKEMQARITAMNQERAKQDTIWNLPSDTSLISKTSSNESKPNKPT